MFRLFHFRYIAFHIMKPILISWLAYSHDFEAGKFKTTGPNGGIHKHFSEEYDKHYLLLSWSEDDEEKRIHEGVVKTYVSKNYPEKVEVVHLPIYDIISVNEIREKLEKFLAKLQEKSVEVFISPGTPAMQTAWYFLALQSDIKLFQTRSAQFRKGKELEREYISISKESIPVSAVLRQESAEPKEYITNTKSLKPIYERAWKISQADDVTTLILGDSGTGKEHLASYIHQESSRKDAPFIAVNCSAQTDTLLSSALFGHKKGAFTDAHENKKGYFEEAKGGTLFLDEIGDISPFMQQSLLRVLQQKEITPLNESKPKKVDVRVIAATNKNLAEECEAGRFRWDLYYRLTVTDLRLPPLVERPGETKLMLRHFLESKKSKFRRNETLSVPQETEEVILKYPFPGNIRELENLVERLYVFCQETATLEDLPKHIRHPKPAFSWKWKDVEKEHLEKALKHFGWHKLKVCEEVGMVFNTLQKRISSYQIKEP